MQNVKTLKQEISRRITEEDFGRKVVELLIPNGVPLTTESELWDFKKEFVGEPKDHAVEKQKKHEILKDVIAFHNAFGGYLIAGIDEKEAHSLVGTEETVDIGQINDLIETYTSGRFKCFCQVHMYHNKRVVLIHIPKRTPGADPVFFIKTPKGLINKIPYNKNDIYIRAHDKCRPANKDIEDWKLLLSDRNFLSGQITDRRNKFIKNTLPAPDPELVRFVGRTEELAELRSWLLNARYPTKMITGIGGLGKTSLAHQFATEVVELNYPGIEQVLWYTAKQKTFAALRGTILNITRYDYTDTRSLLSKMIVDIAGESSLDDDATMDELQDSLLDALSMYPTMFVIDDIDTLSEEEQKLCVAEINNIVLQTVSRSYGSSRALITSRLDQGLSPTAVIKISGLDKDSFTAHVNNVCDQFRIPHIKKELVADFYRVSSGSPLFASSLVRLISLGEDPRSVADKWEGSLGEDVREFAFARELKSISNQAASILLAIIRLETATLAELSEVLAYPQRRSIDLIGELQKFHLISSGTTKGDIPTFSTSKELIAVISPLKEKLGHAGNVVERDCARLKKQRETGTQIIAQNIHHIISLLKEEKPEEALIASELLLKKNPKNPDVHCLYARVAMSVNDPKVSKANSSIEYAFHNGCNRPEVNSIYISIKFKLEEWKTLFELFESREVLIANPKSHLAIFAKSSIEYLNILLKVGKTKFVSDKSIWSIKKIMDRARYQSEIDRLHATEYAQSLSEIYIISRNIGFGDHVASLRSAYTYLDLIRSGIVDLIYFKKSIFYLEKCIEILQGKGRITQSQIDNIVTLISKLMSLLHHFNNDSREFTEATKLQLIEFEKRVCSF